MQDQATPVQAQPAEFMPFQGWRPLPDLWESPGGFPSEQSARWAIRLHRAELTKAGALVFYRRRMYFEPAKFKDVIERAELANQVRRNHQRAM
jgi:hypothetical protein